MTGRERETLGVAMFAAPAGEAFFSGPIEQTDEAV
jgi:hypothetical protein